MTIAQVEVQLGAVVPQCDLVIPGTTRDVVAARVASVWIQRDRVVARTTIHRVLRRHVTQLDRVVASSCHDGAGGVAVRRDGVVAVPGIHVRRGAVVHPDRVVAGATVQLVVATVGHQRVVTGTADQDVVARCTDQRVRNRRSEQNLGTS